VCDSYHADTGGTVTIVAKDDFLVCRVHIAVRDTSGRILHLGDAQLVSGEWQYAIAPPAADGVLAASLIVTAFDLPGNFAIGTFSLPMKNRDDRTP
jgi:hypothetical protein